MVKKKRIINRFINSLFCEYRVPRIPVHIHWGCDYLVDERGDEAFGILCVKDGQAKCIHVAARDLNLFQTMNTVAHEFVHYLQLLHGRDIVSDAQAEKDADSWANVLCGKWIINHEIAKKTGEHCYGIAPIWEVSGDERRDENLPLVREDGQAGDGDAGDEELHRERKGLHGMQKEVGEEAAAESGGRRTEEWLTGRR